MIYTFDFLTDEDKETIINNNKDKFLIEIQYLHNGNFLVFKDELDGIEKLANKISILEAENKILKQELSLTQDAVNEMLFMMMNMEAK